MGLPRTVSPCITLPTATRRAVAPGARSGSRLRAREVPRRRQAARAAPNPSCRATVTSRRPCRQGNRYSGFVLGLAGSGNTTCRREPERPPSAARSSIRGRSVRSPAANRGYVQASSGTQSAPPLQCPRSGRCRKDSLVLLRIRRAARCGWVHEAVSSHPAPPLEGRFYQVPVGRDGAVALGARYVRKLHSSSESVAIPASSSPSVRPGLV
jgi:hypothetical protein